MPMYNYRCDGCGTEFPEFYTTVAAAEREEPDTHCPSCRSTKKTRLVIGKTGVAFKGRGWTRKRGG